VRFLDALTAIGPNPIENSHLEIILTELTVLTPAAHRYKIHL
jgi:hypothetical protein